MDYFEAVNELRNQLEVEYYYDNKYSSNEYETIEEVLQNIPQTNERNYSWWVVNNATLDYAYASDIFQPATQVTVITQYYFNIAISVKHHEYSFHCEIDKAAYEAYVPHVDKGADYSYNELMEEVNKIYRVVNRANRLGSWLSENA
ncbi:hypothetical protein [Hymenobacter sp. APR13]|uniref:hypothetical protein n=1 Tax=Hymenobacter sp. APR13 TaxID=1356852 RepID=UPI0012E0A031|nr:hypothetical protein [Hymenobacter sp. APR13]